MRQIDKLSLQKCAKSTLYAYKYVLFQAILGNRAYVLHQGS